MEIIRTIILTNLVTNQKQESGFQQVGDLVTRNISYINMSFCL